MKDDSDIITWYHICQHILPMSDNRTIESYINTCYLRFYRKPSVFERLIKELVKNNSVDGNNNNNIINNINIM